MPAASNSDGVCIDAASWQSSVRYRVFLRLLALALITMGVMVAVASPASATSVPCWQRVILDWSKHSSFTGSYSASCLRQAMQNEPTDLKIYSSLDDTLHHALTLRSRMSRHLQVAPAPVASLEGTGGSSSQLLLVFIVGILGLVMVAATAAAGRVRPHAARAARPPPARGKPGRPRSRRESSRRTARPGGAAITLAATSGFLVTDRNGRSVGRVESPMYGAGPYEPDAIAVKAGLLKHNLVMADTVDSIDETTGIVSLSVERDSIPTFL